MVDEDEEKMEAMSENTSARRLLITTFLLTFPGEQIFLGLWSNVQSLMTFFESGDIFCGKETFRR